MFFFGSVGHQHQNGKYLDEPKYTVHAISSLDDSAKQYATSCHMQEHHQQQHHHSDASVLKQQQHYAASTPPQQAHQQPQTQSTSLPPSGQQQQPPPGCHPNDDPHHDAMSTVIKSEDSTNAGNVTHSYVLPPFLH